MGRYTLTAQPGNLTVTGDSCPLILDNLENGVEYTFTLTRANSHGTSIATTYRKAVIPYTIPDAPEALVVTEGDEQVSVTFTPRNERGRAVTEFQVITYPGDTVTSGTSSPIVVTNLTNGSEYTFKVKARNLAGWSELSAESSPATPATVPSAPTIGTAVEGDTQADVAFTLSGDDGGATIDYYTATSTPGNYTANDTTSPITVTGLTNGVSYTFKVKAHNAKGYSEESAASNAVTPIQVTVPDAPTIGTAVAMGPLFCDVGFTCNGTGGHPILSAEIESNPEFVTAFAYAPLPSSAIISGLTPETTYTFRVRVYNDIGPSAWSSYSNQATTTAATVPTIASTDAFLGNDNTFVNVNVSCVDSGGSDLTGCTVEIYQAGARPGEEILIATAVDDFESISQEHLIIHCELSCAPYGLQNYTTYYFKGKAANAIGDSDYSEFSPGVYVLPGGGGPPPPR